MHDIKGGSTNMDGCIYIYKGIKHFTTDGRIESLSISPLLNCWYAISPSRNKESCQSSEPSASTALIFDRGYCLLARWDVLWQHLPARCGDPKCPLKKPQCTSSVWTWTGSGVMLRCSRLWFHTCRSPEHLWKDKISVLLSLEWQKGTNFEKPKWKK